MNKVSKSFRKIINLYFPPENSGSPVMSQLVRNYDLTFSILKGQITPHKEGHLTIQVEGDESKWQEAQLYLKGQNISIKPAAQTIVRDDESCMHCGLCTAICPANALSNDALTRMVVFMVERCTACGMCTRVCPVAAMHIDLDLDVI